MHTTDCPLHPDYLESLVVADGEQRSLPAPPQECPICAQTHALFIETSEVLRWRGTEPAPLSSDWQLGVWLQLGALEEAQPKETPPSPDPKPVPPPSQQRSVWAPLAVAAAAVVLIVAVGVLVYHVFSESGAGQQPRRQAQYTLNEQPKSTHVALRAYSLKEDHVETLVPGSRITPGDRLSFDYLNVPGGVGNEMRYLTVVALVRSARAQEDALDLDRNDLRWIAQSEPIEVTHRTPRVLGAEDIPVDVPPGSMTIFGVFSRRPLTANQVEEVLLVHNEPIPGVGVARLPLTVEP
ncbi:MAG: hypothetical protein AAFX99_28440 [Myxococcota bacterium]